MLPAPRSPATPTSPAAADEAAGAPGAAQRDAGTAPSATAVASAKVLQGPEAAAPEAVAPEAVAPEEAPVAAAPAEPLRPRPARRLVLRSSVSDAQSPRGLRAQLAPEEALQAGRRNDELGPEEAPQAGRLNDEMAPEEAPQAGRRCWSLPQVLRRSTRERRPSVKLEPPKGSPGPPRPAPFLLLCPLGPAVCLLSLVRALPRCLASGPLDASLSSLLTETPTDRPWTWETRSDSESAPDWQACTPCTLREGTPLGRWQRPASPRPRCRVRTAVRHAGGSRLLAGCRLATASLRLLASDGWLATILRQTTWDWFGRRAEVSWSADPQPRASLWNDGENGWYL